MGSETEYDTTSRDVLSSRFQRPQGPAALVESRSRLVRSYTCLMAVSPDSRSQVFLSLMSRAANPRPIADYCRSRTSTVPQPVPQDPTLPVEPHSPSSIRYSSGGGTRFAASRAAHLSRARFIALFFQDWIWITRLIRAVLRGNWVCAILWWQRRPS
jgi:hypothetical protein